MLHFNGKIVRTAADLQKFIAECADFKEFAYGVESLMYAWGKEAALELLGKAILGHDDTDTYDDVPSMITKAKRGKAK